MILYEYPFNERIRTYLRLEHLFLNLSDLMQREPALDHHFALTTIFEVMDVAARADLKSDVLKDLEKQKQILNSYRGNPAIAESVLDKVVGQIEHCFSALNAQPGKAGQSLQENDWLMSIRSRVGIPGGTCEFDLPAYHAWKELSAAQRRQDLLGWMASVLPMAQAVTMLLALLRETGVPHKVAVQAGVFQQTLQAGKAHQLLRLRIDAALGLVPEIIGHRLMVSVRLMRQDADGKLRHAAEDAALELSLCA